MKTVRLLQTTVIGVTAAMMLSACGESSSDGGAANMAPATVADKAVILTTALKSVEYISGFNYNNYLSAAKAGTTETVAFPCDSGSADALVTYLSDTAGQVAITDANGCTINGIVIDSLDTLIISINTTLAGTNAFPLIMSYVELGTNVQGHANYDYSDNSYTLIAQSMISETEPYLTEGRADVNGGITTGTHSVTSAVLKFTEYYSTPSVDVLFNYELTGQVGSTLFFTDTVSATDYEYVIQ